MSVEALSCPKCGAPFNPINSRCEYCGSWYREPDPIIQPRGYIEVQVLGKLDPIKIATLATGLGAISLAGYVYK